MQLVKAALAVAGALGVGATPSRSATAGLSPLTPKQLLEAPRMGEGRASPNGLHALIGVTEYGLSSPSRTDVRKAVYHLNLPAHIAHGEKKGKKHEHDKEPELAKPQPLVYNVSDAIFISEDEAAWISKGTLYYKNVSQPDFEPYMPGTPIGDFPVEVTTLKVVIPKDGTRRTLVFSAEVYDDGKLETVKDHDESDAEQEWERVRAYDSTFVRHWDKWVKPNKRSQLFAVDLVRKEKDQGSQWAFASGGFRNLLQDTKLEAPVPPFGGADDYDVSEDSVVFTSRDPETSAAWHTKQSIYIAPLSGNKEPKKLTSGSHGITASPRISPDGRTIVWLQMGKDGFESDKRVLQFHDVSSGKTRAIFRDWVHSPKSIAFAPNGKSLQMLGEHEQKDKLFVVALRRDKSASGNGTLIPVDSEPKELVGAVSVKASVPVVQGGTLITASSHYSTAELYWLAPTAGSKLVQLTKFGAESAALAKVDFGPRPEEIKWAGAGGRTAYGWILKPPGFNPQKKYPLAVLIHGGPEGAWTNAWSVRWNPAVFAAAGFIVFTPNPAGSTSFGQAYQEEILNNWGDKPYHDIISGVHHVINVVQGVDADRVVGAGASFGGYSVNWIQGHNNAGLFKALVCHDGVFNTLATYYSTDELWFPTSEFGGAPWEVPAQYERFNPQSHVANWNTPQLIIHGGRDYRLTESEGLAAFNALQRRGVPSRFLYFPDENHWVLEPRNSLRWHTEVIGWLSKYANATVPTLSSSENAQAASSSSSTNKNDGEPLLRFQHGVGR